MADYDINVDIKNNPDISKIFQDLDMAIKTAVEKSTVILHSKIVAEIPQNSARATGTAKKETKITKNAVKNGNDYFSEIEIGPNYMWKIWKGSSNVDAVHFATYFEYMVFDDWPNGPPNLRWGDGKYRFRQVFHDIKPNDFIERAEQKAEKEITDILSTTIESAFK